MDLRESCTGHHLRQFPLGIGLPSVGPQQHVEGEERGKEGPIPVVVQDELVDEQKAARVQGCSGLGDDLAAVFRILPVEDVG